MCWCAIKKLLTHSLSLQTSVSSVQLHFASIRSHSSWLDILALWGLTNKPPWLNTRSTGANVQGLQKILSNIGFKQTNCLLSLTRHRGLPTSVPSTISCTYARYELTTFASWTPFSAYCAGLQYDANSEVLDAFAGGGLDPVSRSLSASGAGMSTSLTSRAAARIQSTINIK